MDSPESSSGQQLFLDIPQNPYSPPPRHHALAISGSAAFTESDVHFLILLLLKNAGKVDLQHYYQQRVFSSSTLFDDLNRSSMPLLLLESSKCTARAYPRYETQIKKTAFYAAFQRKIARSHGIILPLSKNEANTHWTSLLLVCHPSLPRIDCFYYDPYDPEETPKSCMQDPNCTSKFFLEVYGLDLQQLARTLYECDVDIYVTKRTAFLFNYGDDEYPKRTPNSGIMCAKIVGFIASNFEMGDSENAIINVQDNYFNAVRLNFVHNLLEDHEKLAIEIPINGNGSAILPPSRSALADSDAYKFKPNHSLEPTSRTAMNGDSDILSSAKLTAIALEPIRAQLRALQQASKDAAKAPNPDSTPLVAATETAPEPTTETAAVSETKSEENPEAEPTTESTLDSVSKNAPESMHPPEQSLQLLAPPALQSPPASTSQQLQDETIPLTEDVLASVIFSVNENVNDRMDQINGNIKANYRYIQNEIQSLKHKFADMMDILQESLIHTRHRDSNSSYSHHHYQDDDSSAESSDSDTVALTFPSHSSPATSVHHVSTVTSATATSLAKDKRITTPRTTQVKRPQARKSLPPPVRHAQVGAGSTASSGTIPSAAAAQAKVTKSSPRGTKVKLTTSSPSTAATTAVAAAAASSSSSASTPSGVKFIPSSAVASTPASSSTNASTPAASSTATASSSAATGAATAGTPAAATGSGNAGSSSSPPTYSGLIRRYTGPEYKFIFHPKSFLEIWNEYKTPGLNTHSIETMDRLYGDTWTNHKNGTYWRRRYVWRAIEYGLSKGFTVKQCISLLEEEKDARGYNMTTCLNKRLCPQVLKRR